MNEDSFPLQAPSISRQFLCLEERMGQREETLFSKTSVSSSSHLTLTRNSRIIAFSFSSL